MDTKLIAVLKLLREQVSLLDEVAALRLYGHDVHRHASSFAADALPKLERQNADRMREKVFLFEDKQRKLQELLEQMTS